MADERYPIIKRKGEFSIEPRCDCPIGTRGQWVFEWRGGLHGIFPSNQLQKDCWLCEAGINGNPGPKTREARIKVLRWLCWGCGKVQMP